MTTLRSASNRPFAVSAAMPRGLAAPAIALAFAAGLSQAKADTVIDGTHTRQEIAMACQAVGGAPFNIDGLSGAYGCINPKKDTYIACSETGECQGIEGKAPAAYLKLASTTPFKNQVQYSMPQVQPAR